MTSFRRLLAATDLSAPAHHAAERAALVSQATGASLTLLHVAHLEPLERLRQLVAPLPDDLRPRVLQAARERLQTLSAHLHERHGTLAGHRAVTGPLLAELTRAVHDSAADLLVCGARGESTARHLLLGSTAQRLLAAPPCPLLVVKQAAGAPYRRVLVPVDFSAASLRALRHAQAVAPGAERVLLHVFEVPFEGSLRYASVEAGTIEHYRQAARREAALRLRALAIEAGLPPDHTRQIVLHGDAALRIVEQEQTLGTDLIVMGQTGEGRLPALLLGSTTRHVLAESRGDVLVSV